MLYSLVASCCVQVEKKYYAGMIDSLDPTLASELKKYDSILIGISHSKSRQRMPSSQGDRYNYLSRLYVFSPNEPFYLLARSGLFCFGFTGEQNATYYDEVLGSVGNDYNQLTKSKKLELNKATYDCPNIHFVNSIIEKTGDSDTLIISYGVNDCVVSCGMISFVSLDHDYLPFDNDTFCFVDMLYLSSHVLWRYQSNTL